MTKRAGGDSGRLVPHEGAVGSAKNVALGMHALLCPEMWSWRYDGRHTRRNFIAQDMILPCSGMSRFVIAQQFFGIHGGVALGR